MKQDCICRYQGFTLLELAIVLIVLGVIMSATLRPLSAGIEYSRRVSTNELLQQVIQTTRGFASVHGYLPCPATQDTHGWAQSTCTSANASGYVPVSTLGLTGKRDHQGLLLDSWNRPVRYIVSSSDHVTRGHPGQPDFTTAGEMKRVGMRHLQSELTLCRTAASICAEHNIQANQVPLLVFSLGANDLRTPDQQENKDADEIYVVRDYSRQPGAEFDDLLHWVPENLLLLDMIKAGELP